MRKSLLIAAAFTFAVSSSFSQCLEWANPAPPNVFGDFGNFPCDGQSTSFEFDIFKSLAFGVDNAIEGASYTFSHCDGENAGSWIPEYTIIAPSGEVEAFGAGDGDGCSITWTATEAGFYVIVINEAENCGVGDPEAPNGQPTLTTNSGGSECPPPPVIVEGAESFEGGELPTCWTIVDADGDGINWNFAEGLPGFESDWAIRSESFSNLLGENGEALTPDNYLITPQLTMGDGEDSLVYVVRSVDANFAAENYSVLVSTTGNEVADFTDEVFTEVLESAGWEGRTIDLSAYSNQTIYIAFRHHNVTDEFSMLLDHIALPGDAVDCTLSTEDDNNISGNFSVFPNPSSGVVNLVNSGDTETYQVRVFDISGKVVKQELVNMATGANHEIDLSGNAPGMYTVQFVSDSKAGVQKLVIR